MLMVVILHVLGQGGVLAVQVAGSPGYWCTWFLELLCYCAVDCFGLISGYVGFRRAFRWERGAAVWAQVAFYSLGITLLFKVLHPELVGVRYIFRALLPALTQKYWYFTAYFGLMFFIPYLNILMGALTQGQSKRLLLALMGVLSLLPVVSNRDLFFTKVGYSFVWLAALYLMGACLGKLEDVWRPAPWQCLGGYVLCVLLALGGKGIPRLNVTILGRPLSEDIWVNYTAPTILCAAILLLLFCVQLPVGRGLGRVISLLSPLSFGVYLLHTHPLVWDHVLTGRFSACGGLPPLVCVGAVLLIALGIFTLGVGVDFLRRHLFSLGRKIAAGWGLS